MEKFYFNKEKHTYEKKNIPSFKEWSYSKDLDMPEKGSFKEIFLIDSYTKTMKDQYPGYQFMEQDIRVMDFDGQTVALQIYVDEEEGIVHLLDLGLEDSVLIAEVASEPFFHLIYQEKPSIFKKDSMYDYRYFIYSKDGIVSEWRHNKLWFEKHFDIGLKV